MKAILSNKIYLNCAINSPLEAKLLKNLTYTISREPVSPYPLVINHVTRITDTVVAIPSARLDLIPKDYEIVDKRKSIPVNIPEPKFIPRDQQKAAIDQLTSTSDVIGLVNCPVSWGKTIAGLGIAYKLQEKTLIICTTTMIRDMWVAEVEKWFGFKPGIVGGGKFDISTPIVIGNIATVRNRLPKLAHEFGLILVDEVHRAPAETFTKALNSLYARHKVGLSGTLERKDQLHVVLQDFFGFNKFIGTVENSMPPTIHVYSSSIELTANEFIPWSLKINQLMENPEYVNMCYNLIQTYVAAGHKILVLADRTGFLEKLHLMMPDNSFIITGEIKGAELRSKILKAVAEFKGGVALFGTQSIFSEGVSENTLSCVLLATPINNEPLLKQIMGRIQRPCEGKLAPVGIDINFRGNTGIKHANSRKKTYLDHGWNIRYMGTQ
jgi:superfamily II DNA or RNA helicase